ncbi:hypothetical protein AB0K16_16685 [Nonomuraea jabiensis]|uniref:hypothetical protein n=1 Tax=Nonomuraea jabiensis TaxID=882448 RepID=UPI003441CF06
MLVSLPVPAPSNSEVRSWAVVAAGVTLAPVDVVTVAVPSALEQAASRLPSPSELMPTNSRRRLTR